MSTSTEITVEITVYLAEEGRFFPFTADSTLRPIYKYEREIDVTVLPKNLLERAFMIFNIDPEDIGDEADRFTAEGYRQAGARSLSVGDVIVIGETAWGCDRVGWTPVTVAAAQILPVD